MSWSQKAQSAGIKFRAPVLADYTELKVLVNKLS